MGGTTPLIHPTDLASAQDFRWIFIDRVFQFYYSAAQFVYITEDIWKREKGMKLKSDAIFYGIHSESEVYGDRYGNGDGGGDGTLSKNSNISMKKASMVALPLPDFLYELSLQDMQLQSVDSPKVCSVVRSCVACMWLNVYVCACVYVRVCVCMSQYWFLTI
ncbi:hypothetical protein EON63_06035 [archaeon]|nr:MAG: hypothetical protein EON63_06035 [archaeon]